MESLPVLDELDGAIHEVRRRLDALRAVIAVLPEDQRHEIIAAVFSATQSLGDLYAEFATDMLRILGTSGSA